MLNKNKNADTFMRMGYLHFVYSHYELQCPVRTSLFGRGLLCYIKKRQTAEDHT